MRLDRVNYHFCTNKNAEIHKVKAHFRMPENAVPATYFHWFTEVGSSLQKPLLHTENVFETDSRLVPVEVPAVGRSSMAEVLYPAAAAGLIELRPLLPEDLKTLFPYVFETVLQDIALHRLRTFFDVKTGTDVSVHHDTRDVDACIAQIIVLTDLPFIVKSQVMAAAVSHRHILHAFFPDEVKEPFPVPAVEEDLRMVERPADRFDTDDTPAVDIHVEKDLIEPVEFIHVPVVDDRRDLDMLEPSLFQKVADAPHRPVIGAGRAPERVMRFLQTVDTDGDRPHARLTKTPCGSLIDQNGVARHAPVITEFMRIGHDVKEISSHKRLAARDAQLEAAHVEVTGDLIKDLPVLLKAHLIARNITAAGTAVDATFVAAERQLQEKELEYRVRQQLLAVCGELPHMVQFDLVGIAVHAICPDLRLLPVKGKPVRYGLLR